MRPRGFTNDGSRSYVHNHNIADVGIYWSVKLWHLQKYFCLCFNRILISCELCNQGSILLQDNTKYVGMHRCFYPSGQNLLSVNTKSFPRSVSGGICTRTTMIDHLPISYIAFLETLAYIEIIGRPWHTNRATLDRLGKIQGQTLVRSCILSILYLGFPSFFSSWLRPFT